LGGANDERRKIGMKDLRMMIGIPDTLPPVGNRELRSCLWFGGIGLLLLLLGLCHNAVFLRRRGSFVRQSVIGWHSLLAAMRLSRIAQPGISADAGLGLGSRFESRSPGAAELTVNCDVMLHSVLLGWSDPDQALRLMRPQGLIGGTCFLASVPITGRSPRQQARAGKVLTLLLLLLVRSDLAHSAEPVFPGKDWEYETNGLPRLTSQEVESYLHTLDTTALLVVRHGRVIYQYGDITRLSYLASARKSVLSMLYGPYVASGKINLDATLKELRMSDVGGLLPNEEQAKVVDLITARSGVYHLASNPGDLLFMAPRRGSKAPGTWWLYSNWDFNAAGAAFEQMTGTNIYDALRDNLAIPLGMQDFQRLRQEKSGDSARSRYPAYHMWLSTRDIARLGLLMLHEGKWREQQLIPAEWVRRSTSVRTPLPGLKPWELRAGRVGYGYMWWVWDGPAATGPYRNAYTAMGAYGQFITILPALDMVVAHKTFPTGKVGLRPYCRLLDILTRQKPASAMEQTSWRRVPRLCRVWRRVASAPYHMLDALEIYRKSAVATAVVCIGLALVLVRRFGYRKCLRWGGLVGSGLILLLVIFVWVSTPAKAALPKARIAVKVDPKVLDRYAGQYSVKLGSAHTLTVKRDGDALLCQAGSEFPVVLFPESETVFFNNMENAEVRFIRNEKGEVTGVVTTENGKTHFGRKLEHVKRSMPE
jgi:CubicO group peptidase (beta-lactamase class C family)